MFLKWAFGLAVVAVAICADKHADYYAPAKYHYSYGVEDFKTGDYKMHKEQRDGDVVKGEYRIADPDGSIRTVTYMADDEHGFQAVVKKSEPKEQAAAKEVHEVSHHRGEELTLGGANNGHYYPQHQVGNVNVKPKIYKQKVEGLGSSKLGNSNKAESPKHHFAPIAKQQAKISNAADASKQYSAPMGNRNQPKLKIFNNKNVKQEYVPVYEQSSSQSEGGKAQEAFKYSASHLGQSQSQQNFETFKPNHQEFYYSPESVEVPKFGNAGVWQSAQNVATGKPVSQNQFFNSEYFQRPHVVSSIEQSKVEQSAPQLFYPSHGYSFNADAKESFPQLFEKPEHSQEVQDNGQKASSYQTVINGKGTQAAPSGKKAYKSKTSATQLVQQPHYFQAVQENGPSQGSGVNGKGFSAQVTNYKSSADLVYQPQRFQVVQQNGQKAYSQENAINGNGFQVASGKHGHDVSSPQSVYQPQHFQEAQANEQKAYSYQTIINGKAKSQGSGEQQIKPQHHQIALNQGTDGDSKTTNKGKAPLPKVTKPDGNEYGQESQARLSLKQTQGGPKVENTQKATSYQRVASKAQGSKFAHKPFYTQTPTVNQQLSTSKQTYNDNQAPSTFQQTKPQTFYTPQQFPAETFASGKGQQLNVEDILKGLTVTYDNLQYSPQAAHRETHIQGSSGQSGKQSQEPLMFSTYFGPSQQTQAYPSFLLDSQQQKH